jgi:hypothetical protein
VGGREKERDRLPNRCRITPVLRKGKRRRKLGLVYATGIGWERKGVLT